jgi:hypothetical protein
MKITNKNWFEVFTHNASEISSSISRGDMGVVLALVNNAVDQLNFECGESTKAMYAVYSLKGILQNLPILPREVAMKILDQFVSMTYSWMWDTESEFGVDAMEDDPTSAMEDDE